MAIGRVQLIVLGFEHPGCHAQIPAPCVSGGAGRPWPIDSESAQRVMGEYV
jgi:hypothetical protein